MSEWIEIEKRVERAQLFCDSQRWQEALDELDAALKFQPENAAWLTLKGYLLFVLGRNREAGEAYDRAFKADPADCEVGLVLGIALIRLGNHERAARVLEAICEQHPEYEPIYCQRVYAYTELGDHDRAEEAFYLAQQLEPACPHCYFHIGRSLAARGFTKRALYCWSRVVEICPTYPFVHRHIAEGFEILGRLEDARAQFLIELRQNPGDVEVLWALANLANKSQQPLLAAERLRQILDFRPDDAKVRLALGRALLEADKPQQALDCLENKRNQVPYGHACIEYKQLLGSALYRAGKLPEASEQFKSAISERPQDLDTLAMYADCLLAQRRFADAAACYRRLLSTDLANVRAHHGLGLCLIWMGLVRAGIEHCDRAIQIDPAATAPLYSIVLALVREGRLREARSVIGRMKRDYGDQPMLKGLARLVFRRRVRGFLRCLVCLDPLPRK